MNFSNRILEMQYSAVRKLVPAGETAKAKGIKVYHLNIGQPDVPTPEAFYTGVRNFSDEVLKYANSSGIDILLKSFMDYYHEWGFDFDKEDILVTNGGSEALLFSLIATCDAGDEILTPEPFYTNYNSFADLAGVKIVPFLTKAEDGFHLPSRDEILDKITPKTKAILVSNPGNPTGVVYTKEEVRMLADIAIERDIYFISDEVYREFVYDGLEYTSALSMTDALDRIILIDSISKRYSACGARIGLIATKNKKLSSQLLKLCHSRLCVSTLDQVGAANLINTPKSYFDEVKKEYEHRRDIMYSALSKIPGVVCEKPTGAFYIVAKLPIEDSDDFAKWMLTDFNYNNKTVMVAPAAGFYSTPGRGINEVRFSYCIKSEDLLDAMNIFSKGLETYISTH